jgi:hypothetical protein
MNKKGIAPIIIFAVIIMFLIFAYLLLFLPIPSFKLIKAIINYIIIIILFFTVQAGFIYAYYKVGSLAIRGYKMYKNTFKKWTYNLESLLITHH